MQIPIVSRKILESRIADYLDREGIIKRSNEQVRQLLKDYKDENIFDELIKATNEWTSERMSTPNFYDYMAQRVNGTGLCDILTGRYRDGIAWDIRKIVENVKKDDQMVLDVGCGTGIITYFLGIEHPRLKIEGIDCSAESIKRAQERGKRLQLTNVDLKVQELDELKDSKQQYNLIYCCHSLYEDSVNSAVTKRRISMLTGKLSRRGRLVAIRNDNFHDFEELGESKKIEEIDSEVKYQQQSFIHSTTNGEKSKEVVEIWEKLS